MNAKQSSDVRDRLRSALSSRKELAGWSISSRRERSHQLFLTQSKPEAQRAADVSAYEVQILHAHTAQGRPVLGTASFTLDEGSLALLDQELDKALFAASLVHNEPYTLPGPQSVYPDPVLNDPAVSANPERALKDFQEVLLSSLAQEKGVRLASAEFFLDRAESSLCNHLGLEASQTSTRVSGEIILLAEGQGQAAEFITRPSRRLLKDFDVAEEVRTAAAYARDRLRAGPPPTGVHDVVFAEEALDHFFNPFVSASSAAMKYNRMTTSEPGKPVLGIQNPTGDKLTLWNNGLLDGALGSSRYDGFGTPMARTLLVQDNVLKNFWATKRHADYLKVPVTGDFGNVEVAAGSRSEKEINESGRVYQLLAFSVFEPNSLTGAFSAEIRMGYEITPQGRKPIKGGSVAGTLSRAFQNVHFSQERVQRERYLGPRAILCQGLTLAGS